MRVAVLSLTRDRLDYTRHCFRSLQEHAGCGFDHFVLDQGSTDGTVEWLRNEYAPSHLIALTENVGIHHGLNTLLDNCAIDTYDYDVIARFDNDCEVVQPDTLRLTAELALGGNMILSPRVEGLRNTPRPTGVYLLGGERILDVPQIGGIMLTAPASLYDEFRYDETDPVWGGDDVRICRWWRERGGRVGYIERLAVNHYETTDGQWARYPAYFERKRAEGLPA